jgi:hypothetical protein
VRQAERIAPGAARNAPAKGRSAEAKAKLMPAKPGAKKTVGAPPAPAESARGISLGAPLHGKRAQPYRARGRNG